MKLKIILNLKKILINLNPILLIVKFQKKIIVTNYQKLCPRQEGFEKNNEKYFYFFYYFYVIQTNKKLNLNLYFIFVEKFLNKFTYILANIYQRF